MCVLWQRRLGFLFAVIIRILFRMKSLLPGFLLVGMLMVVLVGLRVCLLLLLSHRLYLNVLRS